MAGLNYEIEEIRPRVLSELSDIEKEFGVHIFYACESGSRAWGFESSDSDFDVRFLYVHPVDWYLSVDEKRDVIERPIDDQLDVSGWDIKKALKLFRKSNPPMIEWLGSPIVYKEEKNAIERIRSLLPEFYSPVSCMYHYLHMAKGNMREYLKGDRVWLKKYLYVLRPVLACLWIEAGHGVVPTPFEDLVQKMIQPGELLGAVNNLLAMKKAGGELSYGPPIPAISNFVEQEIERLDGVEINVRPKERLNKILDETFRKILAETWGDRFGGAAE